MKVACDHWKDWRLQINWKTLEYGVPLKCDTKKTPFCMFSNQLFLKDGLHNNNWVGNSVIKHVDATELKKRKAPRERTNEKSNNFEMEIIDKGALNKALEGPEKL